MDAESSARRAVEKAAADLEKEKTMRELEVQELMSKHKQEYGKVAATLTMVSCGELGNVAATLTMVSCGELGKVAATLTMVSCGSVGFGDTGEFLRVTSSTT